MFGHIDFEKINRIPNFAGTEHGIDCRQDYSGNGNNRPFFSSAFGDALVLQCIVRIALVLHRSVSDLNQGRLEVNTGSGNADRLFLPCGFVVTRGQSGPAAKSLGTSIAFGYPKAFRGNPRPP